MIGIDRNDHMIHFCKRNHIDMNYRINSIIENTQILVIEFEYLQGDSIILDCDSTGWMIVTQSYCKWFHSKIIFRNQMMTKIVI
jgi:hypothetical protein